MCQILMVHDELPSSKVLEAAERGNTDGAGIAWRPGNGKVRWIKGLKDSEAVMKAIEKVKPALPLVIHFRRSTVGGQVASLTHPFPVVEDASAALEGEADIVMFHNGHWGVWQDRLMQFCIANKLRVPRGPWSDTRTMAFFAHHLGEGFIELVGEKIAWFTGKKLLAYGGWARTEKNANIWCSTGMSDYELGIGSGKRKCKERVWSRDENRYVEQEGDPDPDPPTWTSGRAATSPSSSTGPALPKDQSLTGPSTFIPASSDFFRFLQPGLKDMECLVYSLTGSPIGYKTHSGEYRMFDKTKGKPGDTKSTETLEISVAPMRVRNAIESGEFERFLFEEGKSDQAIGFVGKTTGAKYFSAPFTPDQTNLFVNLAISRAEEEHAANLVN